MADADLQGSNQVGITLSYNDSRGNLTTITQIVVGDQLTCKVIRSCKHWVQVEPEAKNKLLWANETPGMYDYKVHVNGNGNTYTSLTHAQVTLHLFILSIG